MKKNNILIIVQNYNEIAADFAKRLEVICDDISKKTPKLVDVPQISFTSASDGRQTANIQFVTDSNIGLTNDEIIAKLMHINNKNGK